MREDRKVRCQNCSWTGMESQTGEIDDFFERVDTTAGEIEIMPSGECPECEALCTLADDELPRDATEFLARREALQIVAMLACATPGRFNHLLVSAQQFFQKHPALSVADYVP